MTQMVEFAKKDYNMYTRRDFRKLVTQTIDRREWFYDSEEYGVQKTLKTVFAIVTTSLLWEIGRHMLLITKKVRPFGKKTETFRNIGWKFNARYLMDTFGVRSVLWMAAEIFDHLRSCIDYSYFIERGSTDALHEHNRFKICLLDHIRQLQHINKYPTAEEVGYGDIELVISYAFLSLINPLFLLLKYNDIRNVRLVETPSIRRGLKSAMTVEAIQSWLQKEKELIAKRVAKRKATAKLCRKHHNAKVKAVLKKKGFAYFAKSDYRCHQCDRIYEKNNTHTV